MTGSYLIVALTTHKGSKWTKDQFEKDYRENHLPRNVHHIDGIRTGFRYQNLNPDRQYTMLAMYTLASPEIIGGAESQSKRREHIEAGIVSKVRLYSRLHEIPSRTSGEKGCSRFLISTRTELGVGRFDDGSDEWVRRRQVNLLSSLDGYCRSTCWKVTDGGGKVPTEDTSKYLVLHELEAQWPDQVREHLNGEAGIDLGEEDIWELVQVEGQEGTL